MARPVHDDDGNAAGTRPEALNDFPVLGHQPAPRGTGVGLDDAFRPVGVERFEAPAFALGDEPLEILQANAVFI